MYSSTRIQPRSPISSPAVALLQLEHEDVVGGKWINLLGHDSCSLRFCDTLIDRHRQFALDLPFKERPWSVQFWLKGVQLSPSGFWGRVGLGTWNWPLGGRTAPVTGNCLPTPGYRQLATGHWQLATARSAGRRTRVPTQPARESWAICSRAARRSAVETSFQSPLMEGPSTPRWQVLIY